MSYNYRKIKRKCAEFMLEKLMIANAPGSDFFEEDARFYSYSVNSFAEDYSKYNVLQFSSSANLLVSNKHIELEFTSNPLYSFEDLQLFITKAGREACNEGYYDKENQKDFLEVIELKTKWIIPLLSLLLSLAAFSFSIYTFSHPNR